MADCDDRKNSLPRGGTSQGERGSPALLDPDYVKISGERYSDWIAFAGEFSRHLRYYDTATGAAKGDWQPFFTRDVSAVIGGIAVADVESYRQEVKQRMDFLKSNDNASKGGELKTAFGELFAAIVTLSTALDEKLARLDGAPDLSGLIKNV